ncbi:37S ribosomal protein S24, mitochondrial [Coemansia sp. RSA 552]|nr:37S ribosomal protein S24, mitochondrial [Coemansia sp. RSA 552]
MNAVYLRSAHLARTAQIARGIHSSSVQLVGRKKVSARHANVLKKRRTGVYKEEYEKDRVYLTQMDDEVEGDILSDKPDEKTDEPDPMGPADHHTFGHYLIENLQDVRKYSRMMLHELPTLAGHAQPYVAPAQGSILRFERSFTMGETHAPEDRKTVLRVKVADLQLKPAELHKFLLLVGVRYDPTTDELRMSEKREASSLLNKKRLADTLTALIAEAKSTDDTFADVPLDFSYARHKHKPKATIPLEWAYHVSTKHKR